MPTDQPSITCPRCGRTSYNRNDIKQRYCGYCHWWTSDPHLGPEMCACGQFLHYSDPKIELMIRDLVAEAGEYQEITVIGVGTWMVQRHYVALHGVNAEELPTMGFRQVA